MKFLFPGHRLIGRLALFAALSAMLLPAMLQGFAFASGNISRPVICTDAGKRFVSLADDTRGTQDAPDREGLQLAHCAYCLQSQGAIDLPPSAIPTPRVAANAGAIELLRGQTPPALVPTRDAYPRGPPAGRLMP